MNAVLAPVLVWSLEMNAYSLQRLLGRSALCHYTHTDYSIPALAMLYFTVMWEKVCEKVYYIIFKSE